LPGFDCGLPRDEAVLAADAPLQAAPRCAEPMMTMANWSRGKAENAPGQFLSDRLGRGIFLFARIIRR
jgi:hypothetical protein